MNLDTDSILDDLGAGLVPEDRDEKLLNEIKKHDDEIAHLAEKAKPVVEDAYKQPKSRD